MKKRMVSAILGMLMPVALVYGGGMEKPAPAEGNAFKGGKACLYEGGVRVPTIMSATPVFDGSGSIIARLCTLTDATEIRQTETRLKEAVIRATDTSRAKSPFLAAMDPRDPHANECDHRLCSTAQSVEP